MIALVMLGVPNWLLGYGLRKVMNYHVHVLFSFGSLFDSCIGGLEVSLWLLIASTSIELLHEDFFSIGLELATFHGLVSHI